MMKQILNANCLFSIIVVMSFYTGYSIAAPTMEAPPGGIDVHIVNPPEDPVPVTIQGQPAAPEPYQQLASGRLADQSFIYALFPAVPDGYRLEIHDVAGRTIAHDESGGALPLVSTCELTIEGVVPGNVIARPIPPGASIAINNTSENQQFSESVLMYVAAGEQARVDCSYQKTVPDVSIIAYIAGILVPVVQ